MGRNTAIEWTDHSWPVVNGCRRVSAGCENCYAERLIATRLSRQPKYAGLAQFKYKEEIHTSRRGDSATLRKVERPIGPRWTGESRLWAPDLALPMRVRRPAKFFVADMGDLFYEKVSDEEIAAVFGVMAVCPQHTFQVLTKRPERMRKWFEWLSDRYTENSAVTPAQDCHLFAANYVQTPDENDAPWPLPNVWLGVSIEDQDTADERIPLLLDTPAAVRFASYEPALGPVDFLHVQWPGRHKVDVLRGGYWSGKPWGFVNHSDMETIDWVIVGGESGPKARPFHLEWARSLIEQCEKAGVAVFMKQLGARPIESDPEGRLPDINLKLRDAKGGDWDEWPADLKCRDFPK